MKYKLKVGKAGASFQGLGADFQHRLWYAELSLHAKSRQMKYYTILWAAIKTSFTDMLLLKWNKINRTDKKSLATGTPCIETLALHFEGCGILISDH